MNFYTLGKNGEPVPENNAIAWFQWYTSSEDKRVATTSIHGVEVSTLFLGWDHNPTSGPPILWETYVMGGKLDNLITRCAGSRKQAEAMHAEIVTSVRLAEDPPTRTTTP